MKDSCHFAFPCDSAEEAPDYVPQNTVTFAEEPVPTNQLVATTTETEAITRVTNTHATTKLMLRNQIKVNVQLGRKLGKLQSGVLKARGIVTETCATLIVEQGVSTCNPLIMQLRNMVRAMKGKNLL